MCLCEHCLCAADYVALRLFTVRVTARKLFLCVLVFYCVVLLAMIYVWASADPRRWWWCWRRWQCPEPSPPPLLCLFTTFKPTWKKLPVGDLTDSRRLQIGFGHGSTCNDTHIFPAFEVVRLFKCRNSKQSERANFNSIVYLQVVLNYISAIYSLFSL